MALELADLLADAIVADVRRDAGAVGSPTGFDRRDRNPQSGQHLRLCASDYRRDA
jgi:hypothetical protein